MPIVNYIQGDITETNIPNIAHGVNCQNKMGSGVAKSLFTKWPEVKEKYHIRCKRSIPELLLGDHQPEFLLGEHQAVYLDNQGKIIYNLFTQLNFGYDGIKYVNYWAIAKCFMDVNEAIVRNDTVKELAIPKIGCGLAGGDWNIVEKIIDDATPDIDVSVYYLENK